jgi:glyoxylase-like metal-dependent hydrolase (beta-lactamase superfamily II)
MLIQRSTHRRHLSNAFLVADERFGTAVFIDSGAPLAPLLTFISTHGLTPTHVLRTHSHPDHVEHEETLDLPVVTSGTLQTGGLLVETIPLPGHSDDSVAFVIRDRIGEEYVAVGDTLFKGSIGGGDFAQIKHAVMDVLMEMPKIRVLLPGHADLTTIQGEWQKNPFVRVWRGEDPEGTEKVRVGDREATLVVWSPDYDGNGKAWVRYDDGDDAIVAGSSVVREGEEPEAEAETEVEAETEAGTEAEAEADTV